MALKEKVPMGSSEAHVFFSGLSGPVYQACRSSIPHSRILSQKISTDEFVSYILTIFPSYPH